MDILLIAFAIIGVAVIIDQIIIPLLDIFFFSCGYTLLYLLNIDKKKIREKQLRLKFLLSIPKIFKVGFLESLSYLRGNSYEVGSWRWYPLFKFEKRMRENELRQ